MAENLPIASIILDDDYDSVRHLADLLGKTKDITLSAHTGNPAELGCLLTKSKASLLFTETVVQSSPVFFFLDKLMEDRKIPAIIFASAYPAMASSVFKYHPIDYLTKPIEENSLHSALSRFRESYLQNRKEEKLLSLLEQVNPIHKICFTTRSGYLFLEPSEILYIQADWNTCEVFLTPGHSEMISAGIGKVAEELPASIFMKLTRSLIINKTFLAKVSRKDRKLWLKRDGAEVVLEVSERVVRGIEGMLITLKLYDQ